jgi:TRAP-type mannitol/chloroaromatic compound transport system permease large subunit
MEWVGLGMFAVLAVPLFVFMGVMLERSRIAEALLDSLSALFGRLRGGLGISVMLVGTLLAASTGIVGATVVRMGLLSLPTMLRRGYDPRIATGTICAAGTCLRSSSASSRTRACAKSCGARSA